VVCSQVVGGVEEEKWCSATCSPRVPALLNYDTCLWESGREANSVEKCRRCNPEVASFLLSVFYKITIATLATRVLLIIPNAIIQPVGAQHIKTYYIHCLFQRPKSENILPVARTSLLPATTWTETILYSSQPRYGITPSQTPRPVV
jgi:hypothetical protein